jgi:hypothetical protein
MTEEEWLACADPKPMLAFLRGKASNRKLRLLISAHAHRYWLEDDELSNQSIRNARQIERFADEKTLAEQQAIVLNIRTWGPVDVPLVKEIFGNPFRPLTINPSWLTSTVLALATGIYDEKAFDRMPILADALQDAGCDNEQILNHCRQPGVHVRGCFVVDLLLNKK